MATKDIEEIKRILQGMSYQDEIQTIMKVQAEQAVQISNLTKCVDKLSCNQDELYKKTLVDNGDLAVRTIARNALAKIDAHLKAGDEAGKDKRFFTRAALWDITKILLTAGVTVFLTLNSLK